VRVRAALFLSLAIAVVAAAPAGAAFPGAPGPIAYSKLTYSDAGGDQGGIFSHGPRKRQGYRQLTDDRQDNLPAYSPNGRTIAFAGNRDPVVIGLLGAVSHIYLMNADGSGAVPLTGGEFVDSNPSFSPDGRRVVFDRAPAGDSRDTRIFIVNVDGSGLRQLSDEGGRDSDPTFTPNGRRIVFVSDRDPDVRTDRSDIFSMSPNGDRVRVLIDGPRNELDPDVSPNGRRIAFASNRDHGPNVFVAKSNGRRVRQLTFSQKDCFGSVCYTHPSWSPSGRHIAFLSERRYLTDLEVMRADGRNRQSFAGAGRDADGYGTEIGAPAWGPKPR
jgi:Tol biopolymer transport system component